MCEPGHPFILHCAPAKALAVLSSWGFRTFAQGGVDESYDEPHFGVDKVDDRTKCYTDTLHLRRQLYRLLHNVSDTTWSRALYAADFNRRHLVCADGLNRLMGGHARRVVNFLLGELRLEKSI